ncbi:MAG: FAD-binding oxidoreductase, partial [Candidatus Heimdallarchaeota archaeon]|nr:FAD-binding oxidoreductase [Candidatus Heimdallarchaeota archaeon]MCK4254986.1 FAD-binding oxidoreductase [Candidatus Heimdallarchaeota archaeon]
MPTNVIVAEKVEFAPFDDIKSVKGDMIISESYPSYLVDESKISGGNAEWLFFPTTENEIVSIINKMKDENSMITISAARTGIVGSAVPFGGAVMSLERMNEIIGIGFDEDTQRWFLRCQPSISLDEINEYVKFKKCGQNQSIPPESDWAEKFIEECTMYYPMDPTEMTASLGGTICANASGARSFKYGPTRDWVRRIRVVLGTCEVLNITRGQYAAEDGIFIVKTAGKELIIKTPYYHMPKAKNAAGLFTEPNMDLIDLFIGSEGIFGIITEADIWIKEYNAQISCVGFFKKE